MPDAQKPADRPKRQSGARLQADVTELRAAIAELGFDLRARLLEIERRLSALESDSTADAKPRTSKPAR